MTEHLDDPFSALRRVAGDPQPSADTEQEALRRLQEAIGAETTPSQRRWWMVAAAAIVLAAVAGGVVLLLGRTPAAATLDQIARAARQATPLQVPSGAFIYQHTESVDLVVRPGVDLGVDDDTVAYLLPTSRESWRQPETGFLLSVTTVGEPMFFDDATETAYTTSNGRALDQVGGTIVERFTDVDDPIADTDWPTDPTELRTAMEEVLAQGGDARSLDVQLFDLAVDILHTATPPQLRAAVIELLASLDLDSIETHPNGRVTLTLVDHTTPATRLTATVTSDGTLTTETVTLLEDAYGIPANTPIRDATYQPPQVATRLPLGQ